jgi:hypothetical protein
VDHVEVLDGEVQRSRARRGRDAADRGIEHRENDAAAVEVMTGARVAFPFLSEQAPIESGCLVEVGYLQRDAEDPG